MFPRKETKWKANKICPTQLNETESQKKFVYANKRDGRQIKIYSRVKMKVFSNKKICLPKNIKW